VKCGYKSPDWEIEEPLSSSGREKEVPGGSDRAPRTAHCARVVSEREYLFFLKQRRRIHHAAMERKAVT
jgi:hypothetical protein